MSAKRLFLLDGMALAYRAYFALIRNPIFNSKKINTSALYGFTNTLLDLLKKHEPTHMAVAFDTFAPTSRHSEYSEYKAQRDEMPEDLSAALPQIRQMLEAFQIPILEVDGYEADDIIGTLAKQAQAKGFDEIFMVTPDKDFGQLVTDKIKMYRPGRQGKDAEIWGVAEVCEKWGIKRVDQVVDMLGLMGDASDNIPGIPGIGEKTAAKLLAEFGSVENLLESTNKLKGKQKEKVEAGKEQALMSKRLATIILDAPVDIDFADVALKPLDEPALKSLFVEFEFNNMGKRLFGDSFKAGRGFGTETKDKSPYASQLTGGPDQNDQGMLFAKLKTISDVERSYKILITKDERKRLIKQLSDAKSFCFDLETTSLDVKRARVIGLAFSVEPFSAYYLPIPKAEEEASILKELEDVLTNPEIEKIGHNLKYDLGVLAWKNITVAGPFFDTMLAHSLVEPDQRHSMDFLAEMYLGYEPITITSLIGPKGKDQKNMEEVQREDLPKVAEYASEDADITLQLKEIFQPMLKEKEQEKLFYDIESPLLPVLVKMEHAGIAIDITALEEISSELEAKIDTKRSRIYEIAGHEFNLNSPKQLGVVLFEEMQLLAKPKKTKTGQYVTNEQVLESLSHRFEIASLILEYRKATKLKSTYVDALPGYAQEETQRVHTTYQQAVTATGRMASIDPNLQNIPIRSDQGKEIRKAFVPQGEGVILLAADYSQIELRIMAEISGDKGMQEAFASGIDIHTATSARVYGVAEKDVTSDMRRNAKMVNFGIIYGISAFGLSQRLGIPRNEAADLIEEYFKQYPGVQSYMQETIASAKEKEYVETITGRRRYLRDINSKNAMIRQAVERTAINMPIQGSAADMIKLAMVKIDQKLTEGHFQTKMLLQVHDELVFEMKDEEEDMVVPLIVESMQNAVSLKVPILVETGKGENWLVAH
ncbi:MAG: DNA polymerase I [Verrucomicrobiota bacterium]